MPHRHSSFRAALLISANDKAFAPSRGSLALAAACLLAAACSGKTGDTGPTGANGSNGGTGSTGATGNTGTVGLSSLILIVDLPIGSSECPAGGEEIESGIDTNRNGVLDPSEVQDTVYLCNGAGADGGTAAGACNASDWTAFLPNLAGCDLAGAQLANADLHSANLIGANLTGATLSGANLQGANLFGAQAIGTDFSGADFTGATLADVDLSLANLAGVRSGSVNGPTRLPDNFVLQGGFILGPGVDLSGEDLTSLDLANLDLSGANFAGATLTGANLTSVDLNGANLGNATLTNTNLTNANLGGANLTSATLTGANLSGTILSGATLTGVVSSALTGTPASLPNGWALISATLVQLGTPDGTTTLACANSYVTVGGTLSCTLSPMQNGQPIYALPNQFTPTLSAGQLANPSQQGMQITFTFEAPAASAVVLLSIGVPGGASVSVTLYVLDTPDSTTTLTCAPTTVAPGGVSSCTIAVKKQGIPIVTNRPGSRSWGGVDGYTGSGIGTVSPLQADDDPALNIGTNFTFTYTAPTSLGTFYVGMPQYAAIPHVLINDCPVNLGGPNCVATDFFDDFNRADGALGSSYVASESSMTISNGQACGNQGVADLALTTPASSFSVSYDFMASAGGSLQNGAFAGAWFGNPEMVFVDQFTDQLTIFFVDTGYTTIGSTDESLQNGTTYHLSAIFHLDQTVDLIVRDSSGAVLGRASASTLQQLPPTEAGVVAGAFGSPASEPTCIDNLHIAVDNPCTADPCEHGGLCTNAANGGYTCQCPAGYSGANCATLACDGPGVSNFTDAFNQPNGGAGPSFSPNSSSGSLSIVNGQLCGSDLGSLLLPISEGTRVAVGFDYTATSAAALGAVLTAADPCNPGVELSGGIQADAGTTAPEGFVAGQQAFFQPFGEKLNPDVTYHVSAIFDSTGNAHVSLLDPRQAFILGGSEGKVLTSGSVALHQLALFLGGQGQTDPGLGCIDNLTVGGDPCSSNPCPRGDVCTDTDAGVDFQCSCTNGGSGADCATGACETGGSNGGCSQTCTDVSGTATCSCGSGYSLGADGKTCFSNAICSAAPGPSTFSDSFGTDGPLAAPYLSSIPMPLPTVVGGQLCGFDHDIAAVEIAAPTSTVTVSYDWSPVTFAQLESAAVLADFCTGDLITAGVAAKVGSNPPTLRIWDPLTGTIYAAGPTAGGAPIITYDGQYRVAATFTVGGAISLVVTDESGNLIGSLNGTAPALTHLGQAGISLGNFDQFNSIGCGDNLNIAVDNPCAAHPCAAGTCSNTTAGFICH